MRVQISNTTNDEKHVISVVSLSEARHWVINHLDCSLTWSCMPYCQPDSVFKEAAIEKVNALLDEDNERYRDYNLNHDDSPIREFVADFSYGESMPDWETVKTQLDDELFHCDRYDNGAFDALSKLIDDSNGDCLKDRVVAALVEAAEIYMEGIYNPRGAILNSREVGELENQVPDDAAALIKLWGLTRDDLSIEYYIHKEMTYCYIDCSYDVCYLILKDGEAVLEILSKEISGAL